MPLTWIEISRQNLLHNLQQFKNITPQCQIWPVVKSNAYGHGLKEVVGILSDEQTVDGFMVVNLEEALLVRQFSDKPIMVLSYFEPIPDQISQAIAKHISLPLYDLGTAEAIQKQAKILGQKATVNIKIDTGTGRLGLKIGQAADFIREVASRPNLEIFSIYSHLAESESENLSFSQEQWQALESITRHFPQIKKHIACSAAAVSLPDTQADIIRLGLSLYGLWPSIPTRRRGQEQKMDLRPVLSWRAKVIQVKDLSAGDSVGYNRTWVCQTDSKIAILPLGYYEGYSRLLSNHSQVLIKGQRCPVRGNICMNIMMAEIPRGMEIKRGETATLIGVDGQDNISPDELAAWGQTINYEIIARLNTDLKRIIVP